jgi:hypothetical protein
VFGDAVADTVTGLSTLTVSGNTALNTNAVTSSGAQTYTGAVTLNADSTLTASTITTQGAVTANAHALTLAGNAVLGGAVIGVTNLSVSGTSELGVDISTTGTQAYSGAMTLSGGDRTLSAGGAVSLGAVDSDSTAARALRITATPTSSSAPVTLGGAVGTSHPLSSLTVAADYTRIGDGVALTNAVTTTGSQNYSGIVLLNADTSLSTLGSGAAGGDLVVTGALNGVGTARSLTVSAGAGSATFGGAIGGTTGGGAGIASMTVGAANISANSVAVTTALNLTPAVAGAV